MIQKGSSSRPNKPYSEPARSSVLEQWVQVTCMTLKVKLHKEDSWYLLQDCFYLFNWLLSYSLDKPQSSYNQSSRNIYLFVLFSSQFLIFTSDLCCCSYAPITTHSDSRRVLYRNFAATSCRQNYCSNAMTLDVQL